jgi:hypothetical protein
MWSGDIMNSGQIKLEFYLKVDMPSPSILIAVIYIDSSLELAVASRFKSYILVAMKSSE